MDGTLQAQLPAGKSLTHPKCWTRPHSELPEPQTCVSPFHSPEQKILAQIKDVPCLAGQIPVLGWVGAGMCCGMEEPGSCWCVDWVDLQTLGSGENSVPAPRCWAPSAPCTPFLGCSPNTSRHPKARRAPAAPREGAGAGGGSLLAPTRPGVAIPGSHFPGKPQSGNALGTSGRGGSLLKNPAGPAGWVRGKERAATSAPTAHSGDRRTQRDPRRDAGEAPAGFPFPRHGEPGLGTLGLDV